MVFLPFLKNNNYRDLEIRFYPGFHPTNVNYALSLLQAQRELETAINAYEQAGATEQISVLKPQLQILTWQNEAYRAVEEERWEKAVDMYQRILREFPDDQRQTEWQTALQSATEEAGLAHHFERGMTYLTQKAWKAAQQEFAVIVQQETGYEQGGQSASSLSYQAKLEEEAENHIKARRWQDGITAYQNLLSLFPNHPTRKEAWEIALRECQEGVELASLFDTGNKNLKQGDLEIAENNFNILIEKRPDYERNGRKATDLLQEIHHKVEIRASLEAESKWEAAIAAYQKLYDQATHEEEKRAWQAEIEHCQREDEITRLFAAGLGHLNQGEWGQAQRAFAEVVHYRPDYRREGQSASQLLDQAVSQTKIDPSQRFREGLAHVERQEWPKAQRAFADVIHQQPGYRQDGQSAGQFLELAMAEGKMPKAPTSRRMWLALILVGIAGVLLGTFVINRLSEPETPVITPTPEQIVSIETRVVPGTPAEVTRIVSEIRVSEVEVTRIVENTATVIVPIPVTIEESGETTSSITLPNVPILGRFSDITSQSISQLAGNQANAVAFAPLPDIDLMAIASSSGVELYAPSPDENNDEDANYAWQIVAAEEITPAIVNKLAFTQWKGFLLLAAALNNGEIMVWEVTTDPYELKLHNASIPMRYRGNDEITSLSFSPDGFVLASVDQGGDIKLWCMINNSEIAFAAPSIGEHSKVIFYPKSTVNDSEGTLSAFLVSSGDNDSTGTIKLWRVDIIDTTINCNPADDDRPEIPTDIESLNTTVNDLAFTDDGLFLAAATEDNGVFLWGVQDNGELTLTFENPPRNIAHTLPVNSINFLSSRQSLDPILVTGSGDITEQTDGILQTWMLSNDTGQPLQITNNHLPVTDVAFSPNWPIIAFTLDSGPFRLRHANIQQEVRRPPVAAEIAFARNEKLVSIGHEDGSIQVTALDGSLVDSLQMGAAFVPEDSNDNLVFYDEADNCGVILAATVSNQIWLWQFDEEQFQPFAEQPISAANTINSIDFACHNGDLYLAAGADDAIVKVWQLEIHLEEPKANDTPPGIIQPNPTGIAGADVNSVSLTSTGQELILVAGFDPEYTPRRWLLGDSSSPQQIPDLSAISVRQIAMSPNTNTIAFLTEDNVIQRWQEGGSLQTFGDTLDIDGSQPMGLVVLDNGDVLVVGLSDSLLQIWDSISEQMEPLSDSAIEVVDIFVSSDGTAVFSLAKDGRVMIWGIFETE